VGRLSVLLVLLGVVAVTVAVPALWVNRVLLDTDAFTERTATILDDPDVRAQVASRVTGAITSSVDIPLAAQRVLQGQMQSLMGTQEFEKAWRAAQRGAHRQAVKALTGQSSAVAVGDTTISVSLGDLVRALKPRLVAAGVPFASRIPEIDASVTLVESPEVGRFAGAVRFLDAASAWLPWAALALLLAGVLVSPHPLGSLALAGLATAVGMGLLAVAVFVLRSQAIDAESAGISRAVGAALYDSLTAPLRTWLGAVGLLGGLVALLGWLTGGWARRRRAGA
jgi:hypothetical protein